MLQFPGSLVSDGCAVSPFSVSSIAQQPSPRRSTISEYHALHLSSLCSIEQGNLTPGPEEGEEEAGGGGFASPGSNSVDPSPLSMVFLSPHTCKLCDSHRGAMRSSTWCLLTAFAILCLAVSLAPYDHLQPVCEITK